jgi:uncharacterized damage-inducible protein DinB
VFSVSSEVSLWGILMNPSEMIDAYVAGIQTLRQAVAGLTREQVRARPVAGKWSTLEVVCHLADCGQAYSDRMKRILAEERPLLIAFDETRYATALAYQERDLEEELSVFDLTRRQMARILRAAPAAAWPRQGVHSEAGLRSLEQFLVSEINHVQHHIRFILEKRKALGLA